jgi:serine/threonine protein kinase
MTSTSVSSSSLSGECLFNYDYPAASQDSEVARRPSTPDDLPAQGAFLGLLIRLQVPVLNRATNPGVGQALPFVGAGRSFSVTRSLQTLNDSSVAVTQSYEFPDEELKSKVYVIKRINPLPPNKASDRVQLAAITNEIRILANKTLKPVPSLVKLICVAWDETPILGRHWPRLLIEAADHGNLAEFMSLSEDSHSWDVKLEIFLDILSGLRMLHNHQVTHCDLKLENVLIFRSGNHASHPLEIKYQAKLCDFGFSVIMSDYGEGASFSAVMGSEPWNAPELTFGTPIKIEELPAADVYSFSLLFARVLMHGGDPFEQLSREDIRDLKRSEDTMALYNKVHKAVFDRVTYSEAQQHLISMVLLMTLNERPDQRCSIPLLGKWLILLGVLFRE